MIAIFYLQSVANLLMFFLSVALYLKLVKDYFLSLVVVCLLIFFIEVVPVHQVQLIVNLQLSW